MIRPAAMGGRQRLRAVQCPPTDPVSYALADGESTARFPDVAGWSIRDVARRSVAEHAAWLAEEGDRGRTRAGTELGLLITAARGGLLWEGVETGEPELPLTVDATLELLAASAAGAGAVADAVRESYHAFAVSWAPPAEPVIAALRDVVERLPAYAPGNRVSAVVGS
jgi:hypothetical protein